MGDSLGQSDRSEQTALVQNLFIRHSNAIRGYLLAMNPDMNETDDLLQSVFICVTEKADDFERGSNFVAWARAIARIELLRARREGRSGALSLSPEIMDTLAESVPEFNFSNDRLVALTVCLDELAPQARRVIELRYHEAQKPKAIAERMSLGQESVYVTLSRARTALRDCMDRKHRSAEDSGP